MPQKLLAEAEGILAWAVSGAKAWHESGLVKPPEVEAANESWRAEMDQIGRFVMERCILAKELRVLSSSLYKEYKEWGVTSGEEHVMSQKGSGSKLAEREGIASTHTSRGTLYSGIAPAPPTGSEGDTW